MYIVYALYYESGRIYVGMTNDLSRRIKEHQRGKTKSTKNRGNFNAVILDKKLEKIQAKKREIYWKSGIGREQLTRMGA